MRYYHKCAKVSVLFDRLKSNLIFLDKISKNTEVQSFMKIRPVGAELFHADEANSQFSQFCERG
jgi:hypothetical protein